MDAFGDFPRIQHAKEERRNMGEVSPGQIMGEQHQRQKPAAEE
ncbi:MAG: hypothetical protein ACI82N_000880 [Maricaulis sp.]|jgi:hypothetical protein